MTSSGNAICVVFTDAAADEHLDVDVRGAPGVPAGIDGVERHLAARIGRLQTAQERLTGAVVPGLRVLRVVPGRVALPDLDARVGQSGAAACRIDDRQRQRERRAWTALCDVTTEERRIAKHAESIGIRTRGLGRRGDTGTGGATASARSLDDASVVGLVGDDEPQPAVIAAPTAAILPSTARRLNRLECGMGGPLCKASACRIEQIVHNLRRARTVALSVLRTVSPTDVGPGATVLPHRPRFVTMR